MAGTGLLLRFEAAAIVLDDYDHALVIPFQVHARPRGLGVPNDVRERLLHDAVERELGIGSQTCPRHAGPRVDLHP
jgi:hypothetical protein